jgi:hypothetical protein
MTGMMRRRKIAEEPKPVCPKCNSQEVTSIIHGYPAPEAMRQRDEGKALSGGCLVDDDMPNWYCKGCEHKWK